MVLNTLSIKYFFYAVLIVAVNSELWNYEVNGPDAWPFIAGYEACSGSMQSPIDIDVGKKAYDPKLKPFNFKNYGRNVLFNITNNGETVKATFADKTFKLGIDGSNFKEEFDLLQFHFHWGWNDYEGSEHRVESKKFPLELHIVHKSKKDVLAVLGFLFQLDNSNDNPKLTPLIDIINNLEEKNEFALANLKILSILPGSFNLNNYYRYSGSLTSPPCSQGVIWTVFDDKISISHNQLLAFRKNSVKHNNRDVQELNRRVVTKSFTKKDDDDDDKKKRSILLKAF